MGFWNRSKPKRNEGGGLSLSAEEVFSFPGGQGFALCAEVRDKRRKRSDVVRLAGDGTCELFRISDKTVNRRASARLSGEMISEIESELRVLVMSWDASNDESSGLGETGALELLVGPPEKLFVPILDFSWRFEQEVKMRIGNVDPQGDWERLLERIVKAISPSTKLFDTD